MRIAITGAAGFGGLNFMKYFTSQYNPIGLKKYDVIGLYTPDLVESSYELRSRFGNQSHPIDIRSKSIKRYLKGVDVIINEEALIHAPQSVKEPTRFHDYNVNGFLNILECAKKLNVKVVCVGSNISYGEPVYKPIDEDHPQNPNSPYGATRVCQEKYAISYYHSYDLPIIVLRYSNLYGIYGEGVINAFIKDAINKNKITIAGGLQTRTYTHIMDAAKATDLAINSNKAVGNIYNVAGDETVDLHCLANIIKEYSKDLEIEYKDNWKGDITSSNYKISNKKIKKELGFKPEYTLRKGIKEVIEWESQYIT